MSVAGIDIGSSKACIAVARKRGIDVLMNKTSKRVRCGGLLLGELCLYVQRGAQKQAPCRRTMLQ